jgi:phage terminase small subunit
LPKKTTESEFSKAPPKHLSADSAAFFRRAVNLFEFDEHHVRLLTLACESWDRAVQARQGIEQRGLTFVDRHGSPKPIPEIAIEKDSRIAFARLVRELGLDMAPPVESRPPALRANQR